MLALHFFLTRSRLGKAMRAMADNADLAQVSGINTQLVVRVTWLIAGALACLAGTMLALDVQAEARPCVQHHPADLCGGGGRRARQGLWRHRRRLAVGFAETLAVFDWSGDSAAALRRCPTASQLPPNIALVPTEYKLTVAFVILVVDAAVAADRHLQGGLDMSPRPHAWRSMSPAGRSCC